MKKDKNRIEIHRTHSAHLSFDLYFVTIKIGNLFEGTHEFGQKFMAKRAANTLSKLTGFKIYDLTDKCTKLLCEHCGEYERVG